MTEQRHDYRCAAIVPGLYGRDGGRHDLAKRQIVLATIKHCCSDEPPNSCRHSN
jgi:hypothetical protein